MLKKKLFVITTFLVSLSFNLSAQAVCVGLIQNDSTQKESRLTSMILQEEVLESLYEQGFIVTDTPLVNVSKKSEIKSALEKNINQAKEGACLYLISLLAEYEKDIKSDPEVARLTGLKKISWALMETQSKTVLKEGTIKVVSGSESDDESGVRKVIAPVLKEIAGELLKMQS